MALSTAAPVLGSNNITVSVCGRGKRGQSERWTEDASDASNTSKHGVTSGCDDAMS